ncbi:MAG: hypothetical protein R2932_50300 [Caldilineaceae bacterium]
MDKIPYKRYSIGFKRQVVQEYEAGSVSHGVAPEVWDRWWQYNQ